MNLGCNRLRQSDHLPVDLSKNTMVNENIGPGVDVKLTGFCYPTFHLILSMRDLLEWTRICDGYQSAIFVHEQPADRITIERRNYGVSISRSRSDLAEPDHFVFRDRPAGYFEDRGGNGIPRTLL